MHDASPAYGLWSLVIINSLVFIIFAASFTRMPGGRDWRSLGAFSAFVVALFTEMYGFPLTIYLLSGWLGNRIPGLDPLSHNAGHLWTTLLGWKGNPHFSPIHILSDVLIGGGFVLIVRTLLFRVLLQGAFRGCKTQSTSGGLRFRRVRRKVWPSSRGLILSGD